MGCVCVCVYFYSRACAPDLFFSSEGRVFFYDVTVVKPKIILSSLLSSAHHSSSPFSFTPSAAQWWMKTMHTILPTEPPWGWIEGLCRRVLPLSRSRGCLRRINEMSLVLLSCQFLRTYSWRIHHMPNGMSKNFKYELLQNRKYLIVPRVTINVDSPFIFFVRSACSMGQSQSLRCFLKGPLYQIEMAATADITFNLNLQLERHLRTPKLKTYLH